jgi:hypothetical protein
MEHLISQLSTQNQVKIYNWLLQNNVIIWKSGENFQFDLESLSGELQEKLNKFIISLAPSSKIEKSVASTSSSSLSQILQKTPSAIPVPQTPPPISKTTTTRRQIRIINAEVAPPKEISRQRLLEKLKLSSPQIEHLFSNNE